MMNDLEIELLFRSGFKEIPPGMKMNVITEKCQSYVQQTSLTTIQKEYLSGLSQTMSSAHQYAYSSSFLNIYIVSNLFSIERLINLYHQLFLNQKDNFNFRESVLNIMNENQVEYPYLSIGNYQYQQLIHSASVLDLTLFMKETFNCLDEWDFGNHKRIIIQLIFLQMLILYRTIRKNKILQAYLTLYGMIINIENENYIDLLLLFSPLINKKLDETLLDFDRHPTSFSLDNLKDTLLHHTQMGEQYMIQQVQKYLNPCKTQNSAKHTLDLKVLLDYQQLKNIEQKTSNIESKKLLESLDLENDEGLRELLTLITPFHQRNLEDEIILLQNLLNKLNKSNQIWCLDYQKDEMKIKISYLLDMTRWINNQPSPIKEALFLYYQKNIKPEKSLESFQYTYQELQSFGENLEMCWIRARLSSDDGESIPVILNNICDPNQNNSPEEMLSHLIDLQNSDEGPNEWLIEPQTLNPPLLEKISILQNILEILKVIKDSNMRNIYFSYIQTHLDLFSSMSDLNHFLIFLKNKLIDQDLDDIVITTNQDDLENTLNNLKLIFEHSQDLPLIDSINERLIFLTKIYTLMQLADKINQTPLGYLQYFAYLFLSCFGYQTPNYQARVILQQLQDIVHLNITSGQSQHFTDMLAELENHQIFKNIEKN